MFKNTSDARELKEVNSCHLLTNLWAMFVFLVPGEPGLRLEPGFWPSELLSPMDRGPSCTHPVGSHNYRAIKLVGPMNLKNYKKS